MPPLLIPPLLFSFLVLHQVLRSRYRSPVHVGNSSFQTGLPIWETATVWDAMIEALKVFNRVLIQFVCSVLSSSALTHKKKKKKLIFSLFVRTTLFNLVCPREAPASRAASKMMLHLTQTEELSLELSVYICVHWLRHGFVLRRHADSW